MSERAPNHEGGEQLRINCFIIPQDQEQDMRLAEFGVHDLTAKQEVVGGYLEAVDLVTPPATLYINEEGKLDGSTVNHRATALLWMHNPAFREQDAIFGDALLLGPPDREGNDTAAPEELVGMLTRPGDRFVEFQRNGTWYRDNHPFDDWYDAYVSAFHLGSRVEGVEALRVRRAGDG